MQNAILVASFSPDEPIRNIDYRSELEEIERDRERKATIRLMTARTSVCG